MSREFKKKDILVAWLIGEDVQLKMPGSGWVDMSPCDILENTEWRIKPAQTWVNVYMSKDSKCCFGAEYATYEEAVSKAVHDDEFGVYVKTVSVTEAV